MSNICPDCGREGATNAQEVADGFCPKWWAMHDELADLDCKQYQNKVEIDKAVEARKEYSTGVHPRIRKLRLSHRSVEEIKHDIGDTEGEIMLGGFHGYAPETAIKRMMHLEAELAEALRYNRWEPREVKVEEVREYREKTGAGMVEAKKHFQNRNFNEALDNLRQNATLEEKVDWILQHMRKPE